MAAFWAPLGGFCVPLGLSGRVSRVCGGFLEPSWRPLGQSIGSLRQCASHISKDLLEDIPACPTIPLGTSTPPRDHRVAKWACGMSEAIRCPTGYGVWNPRRMVCKNSFPSVPLPTHSSYQILSSEPWQPLLGSSPRAAHSAGPGAPAAPRASAGGHFALNSSRPSHGRLPDASGRRLGPLRRPSWAVFGASWSPLGFI